MFQLQSARSHKRFVVLFFLLLGLSMMPVWTDASFARVRSCRGDPIVVLSDKRVVRMTVEVAAAADEINVILYTLHVPRGVTAKQITYTGGALSKKERVDIIADLGNADEYTTTTHVMTMPGTAAHKTPVEVKATSQVQNRPQSVIGESDKPITIKFDMSK